MCAKEAKEDEKRMRRFLQRSASRGRTLGAHGNISAGFFGFHVPIVGSWVTGPSPPPPSRGFFPRDYFKFIERNCDFFFTFFVIDNADFGEKMICGIKNSRHFVRN